MSALGNKILSRIDEKCYGAFTSADFADLGNYKAVSKALERLEDEETIKRIRRGVYYLPKYNKMLGIEEAPEINEIALALSRQLNIIIVPSGNFALNIIGLSTQVPTKYVYLTNGGYNEYEVGGNKIYFKHSTSREIAYLPQRILLAVQALKAIGKENVDEGARVKISSFLSVDDKEYIRSNNLRITSWIYEELKKIGGVV